MLELAVSMGLLTLVMAYVLGLFASGTQAPARLERSGTAHRAAAAVLNRFVNMTPGSYGAGHTVNGDYDDEFIYRVDVTPCTLAVANQAELLSVKVAVESKRQDGVRHEMQGLKMLPVALPDGQALYLANDCNSCHSGPVSVPSLAYPSTAHGPIPQSGSCIDCHSSGSGGDGDVPAGAVAPIFSAAGLEASTSTRLGSGGVVEDYIKESILTPGAFNANPSSYTAMSHGALSDTDASAIATYLRSATGAAATVP